jgi:methylthioribose-1-phosphate isomerase
VNVDGVPTRTLRAYPRDAAIDVVDQTRLPGEFRWARLVTLAEVAHAIRVMRVRGAPLIGVTAAYGVAIALTADASDTSLQGASRVLAATRPTAVNLGWALTRMQRRVAPLPVRERAAAAWAEADAVAEEDVAQSRAIGRHGLGLLRGLTPRAGETLHVMTHCNAGWLAAVDWGTALAPVYAAFDEGLPVHVWVSETRPRNQGLLTAWELAQHGVPHTVVADSAAGILMRADKVDAVIVGADRVAANGDVANKVGTYLKALAAADNGMPFYVAAPHSTLDLACPNGAAIPIEERDRDEIRLVRGVDVAGAPSAVRQLPAHEAVRNPAFDVTPARLVTALITERGVCLASRDGLAAICAEAVGA